MTDFAVWYGVMYTMPCFIKWSQKTKRFTTFGGWSISIIVSMLGKSACNNSKGMVTMISHIGALTQMPSCWIHHLQLLITLCIWVAILGHQNWSFSKHSVCCWPWCPASWWHPFMAATLWALGTTLQNFLQFTSGGVAVVKDSLVEC